MTHLRRLLLVAPLAAVLPALAAAQPAAPATTPLTLSALFDSVGASHPAVRAGDARLRSARGDRRTAGALGNPVLSYGVENAPFPGGDPIAGIDRETMTTASIPLEPFFQRWSRVRGADAMVAVANADRIRARQRTALDAAAAFYEVALAQLGTATARDLVAWLDTLVAYNRARVAEGVAAESDLLRVTLERDRAAADAVLEEAGFARARSRLAAFLGDPRRIALAGGVATPEEPLTTPPTATGTDALAGRPDVRAARSRLDASRAAVTTERTMILRTVDAMIGTKQMAGTTSMIAGFSLPFPLFDQNRGQMARASADREAAELDLLAEERAASADLIGAEESARLLTEHATRLSASGPEGILARADESRRVGLGAYREGAVPLLHALDAVRAWGEARMSFYRTLYAQHQSVLELLVARGDDLFQTHP